MRGLLRNRTFDIAMVVNFDACFLVPLLVKSRRFFLDIRTGSVAKGNVRRSLQDFKTMVNTWFFREIMVISNGIAAKFRLRRFTLLPLGADTISAGTKTFADLRLVYVGTFTGRSIEKTIEGFGLFAGRKPAGSAVYHLIGFGTPAEEALLKQRISELGLEHRVIFHGRVQHAQLGAFFDRCNAGVSFVPITPYYDFQPPTKTFEYLLSGMPCVATATYENKQIITEANGVLCDDNAEAFAQALEQMSERLSAFDSETIREQSRCFSWETIVKTHLLPYLQQL
jgi:glycosyltransferase involved in cell wall biosynthesis